jgi:hypothetical protein
VRLDKAPQGDEGYAAWLAGLKGGSLYCGDGRSHFLEFTVEGKHNGEGDLLLHEPSEIRVHALIAARLEPTPPSDVEAIRNAPVNRWNLENARIGSTRDIAVELVVNGIAVDKLIITADGEPGMLNFITKVKRSSWIALRILPSAHTHPVFVLVDGRPVRASRRSALWCRKSVDKLWSVKSPFMRDRERADASRAYDHARSAYERIGAECDVD